MGKIADWLIAGGAALSFALAMLLWGLAPASDCSTPHEIHWWAGIAPFSLFVAAGGYITARGTIAQRLLLFLASTAVVAAYTSVLSEALPTVIATEIACAARAEN